MSTNEEIRDDLVAHDVDLHRLAGDVRNRVERRYDELDSELRGILAKRNPHGALRRRTKQKRLQEFQADARKAIVAANQDVHDLLRSTLKGVARLESTAVVDSIKESLA